MLVVLLFVIGAVVAAPAVAAAVVSVASRSEDAAWTLSGPPAGPVQAAARRIVAFHGPRVDWPAPESIDEVVARERALVGTAWQPALPVDSSQYLSASR
jgi:hypothetical protein